MNNIIISNKKPIVIGRQGENQVTTIRFSIDALFPHIQNATYGLLHQRHGDAAPYPVTTMAIGGYVNWVINSGDLGSAGNGTAQLTAYKDGAVAKSIIFTTITLTSMGTTDAPDPVQIYIDRVVRAGQEAVNAAADAEESAGEAAASAEAAAGSAEAAAGSAEDAAGSAEDAAGSAEAAQRILDDISGTVEAELAAAKQGGEFDGPRGYSIYGGYGVAFTLTTNAQVYTAQTGSVINARVGDYVLGTQGGNDQFWLMKVISISGGRLYGSYGNLVRVTGLSGYSPTVTVDDITDGHRVTITDASGVHTFDVMDGEDGEDSFSIYGGADVQLISTTSAGTFIARVSDLGDGVKVGDFVVGRYDGGTYKTIYLYKVSGIGNGYAEGLRSEAIKLSSPTRIYGGSDVPLVFEVANIIKANVSDIGATPAVGDYVIGSYSSSVYMYTVVDVQNGVATGHGAIKLCGPTIPAGGTTGQVLRKKSNSDYDVEWATI